MIDRITVAADLVGIRDAGPWVRSVLDAHLTSERGAEIAARVELAVHEVAVNIVQHGGADVGTIEMTATVTDDRRSLLVEVVADGPAFDPDAQPEPEPGHPRVHGYGLMIVRRLTTELTHVRRGGRNHTGLRFDLPGPRAVVLVVDDDTASRVVLRHLLARSGLVVVEAVDGGEALALLDASTFDLIISDHEMPGMSGLELRGRLGEGLGTPFVLLTGYANPDEFDPDELTGIDAYLTKPVSSGAIRDLLGRLGRGSDDAATSGPVAAERPARR